MRNFSKLSKAELRELLRRPISQVDADQLRSAMWECVPIVAQVLPDINPETFGLADEQFETEEAHAEAEALRTQLKEADRLAAPLFDYYMSEEFQREWAEHIAKLETEGVFDPPKQEEE